MPTWTAAFRRRRKPRGSTPKSEAWVDARHSYPPANWPPAYPAASWDRSCRSWLSAALGPHWWVGASTPDRRVRSRGIVVDVNRLEAAEAILRDHRLTPRRVKINETTWHHWTTCSCGYESSPGRSKKFAVSSGIGHIQRVADRLMAENGVSPPTRRELSLARTRKAPRAQRADPPPAI